MVDETLLNPGTDFPFWQLLFSLLLHFLMDMMMQDHPPVQLFDQLTPMLHRLLRYDPEAGTATVTRLILDRHDEFQQICQRRSGRGRYMGLDTVSSGVGAMLCIHQL